eukprot:NODE_2239_length_961_cov_31.516447_g1845_i0.p2 GENE.NODE_2239_length_961_cov_31.516447_g1845_i0~~NODE_2239_length_961_cov_31.516447_g1845_i0.p2  ORF type:complete len:149 (-),score=2.81 NODE_2239_length_961_cov_31.516447_g1845_i0:447-893(-)
MHPLAFHAQCKRIHAHTHARGRWYRPSSGRPFCHSRGGALFSLLWRILSWAVAALSVFTVLIAVILIIHLPKEVLHWIGPQVVLDEIDNINIFWFRLLEANRPPLHPNTHKKRKKKGKRGGGGPWKQQMAGTFSTSLPSPLKETRVFR